MDKAPSDSVVAQFRSAFPDGAFTQVDVLGYGDDPDVSRTGGCGTTWCRCAAT